jgi:hypothetical protein
MVNLLQPNVIKATGFSTVKLLHRSGCSKAGFTFQVLLMIRMWIRRESLKEQKLVLFTGVSSVPYGALCVPS